jgi:hypothetical protein
MARFIPTVTMVDAKELAELCIQEVFHLFGMPKEIITDTVLRFTGKFFTELCRLVGIKQSISSA